MKTAQDFGTLGLSEDLVSHIGEQGFKMPTAIQVACIPAAMSGKDVLGIAPTGTGKTAAFGIPAIANLSRQKDKQVLILAPTRELAAQIMQFMLLVGNKFKIKGALVVGGESIRQQSNACQNGVDFIVATPGRLMDLMGRGLDLSHVGMLILDEVDQMLDMGFARPVEEIVGQVSRDRQILFFSATMPAEIRQMAERYLKDPTKITVERTAEHAPKIQEKRINVTPQEKAQVLFDEITTRSGKALIFSRTQRGAEQVSRQLNTKGIVTSCLHGGLTQRERKQALESFRTGKVRILVATDIAARGIDVPDIEIVVNFDAAANREDHLHRVGRTGRFGKEGQAITLHCAEEIEKTRWRGRPERNSARENWPANRHTNKPENRPGNRDSELRLSPIHTPAKTPMVRDKRKSKK